MSINSRRDFLKTSSASLLSLVLPDSVLQLFPKKQLLKIGLISDLHMDIIHDGEERLGTFLENMKGENPHALIQLGDFAIPKPENSRIIQAFNSAHPKAFHVLGNHDMDGGFTREQVTNAFGMSGLYYTADLVSILMIVLDGNDPGSPKNKGGYASYIGPAQQAWLIDQLEKAEKPVLVVSHQPIAGIFTIDNREEIQEILSRFSSKILLAINGHAHVDQHIVVDGVNYLHLNSASYYWVGESLEHESLPPETHRLYPSLKYTCPYADPLYAVLTIDPQNGLMEVRGTKSEWIGPSPQELGSHYLSPYEQKENLKPEISSRDLKALSKG